MNDQALDAAEVKKQKEAEADFQREKKLRLSDMRKVLSTPEGRRYVWAELERSGIFTPSFSLNSVQTAYNEGQRSIGIALLSDVEVAKPGTYYQMYSEAMSKKNSAKKQEESNGGTS